MKNNCSSVKMSEELTRRGYADGSYMCICKTCEGIFQGDKRAWTCKGCAASADRIEELEAERDAFRLALRAYRSDKEMGEKMIEELGLNVSCSDTGER